MIMDKTPKVRSKTPPLSAVKPTVTATPYQLANQKAPLFNQSADPYTRSLQQGFEHGWSHGTTGDIVSFDRDLLGTTTNAESAKKGFFFARDPQNPPEHLTKKSNDQAAIEMLRKAGVDVDALNTVSMEGHGAATASDYTRIGGSREYKDVVNKSNAAFARGDYDEYERLQDIVEDLYKAKSNESQGLVARHGEARDVMLDRIQRAFYDPMAGKSQAELEAFDKQYSQLFPHNWWQTATPEQFKSIESNIVSQLGAERAAPVLDAIKQYQSINTDRIIDEYVQTGANVIPAALRYKNPLVYDFEGSQYREQKYSDLVNQALQNDHDAVILKNTYDPGVGEAKLIDVGVVFDPKNIRSRFAAFDPEHTESTDITKAHGGVVHKAEGGMVDSLPEEAIKNTITDPQAFKMLDMDLANLALMSQRMQPQRMAGGGAVNMDEGGLLQKALRVFVPAQVRTFVGTLAGDESPITEKNFSGDELDQMRKAIMSSRQDRTAMNARLHHEAMQNAPTAKERRELFNRGPSKELDQTVGYQHYPGSPTDLISDFSLSSDAAIRNTLGRFAYEKTPEGNLVAKDLYKFRGDQSDKTRPTSDYADMGTAAKLWTLTKDTFGDAGLQTLPSRTGNAFLGNKPGRPVNVNLGKAPFAQGGAVHMAGGGSFNPQGADYDYQTARAHGMGQEDGGNWGSVAPASESERKLHGLPDDSYLILKGAQHPTWGKAVEAEESRGSRIVKHGDRYYSVPKMAGGGRPPLRSLDEVPSDEYLKAEIARINAAPTVRANSADETANYARYVAERAGQPIEMPARPDYTPGFSVLEKPTYGSEVPGTTPTIDQQRFELTMKGQQDAANKRYRAQQGDALAGMDPTGTLAVTDAARTMGLGMLALPVHAGRTAFHYLQHGNMKDAPTGMDYEEFMSPRTAEGAELVEEIGTAGSRLTGSEMGFGLNPTLWAYAPPTVAQMRAGLKLGAERAAPVIKDIGAMANDRYLTGKMPGMVAPASPVTTWHGTGHDIEGNKFSNEKIGTGEGNQAFGYGHYSAEARPVAEWYRDILSIDPNQGSEKIKYATLEKFLPNESPDVQEQIKGFLSGLGYYDRFVTTIKREGSDALKAALLKEEPLLFSSGNLYKIDIPDPVVEKMLDWDKPLKDQSPHVQKALAKISPDQYGPDSPDYDPSETGGMIYQRVVSIANSKVSPEWIKKRDLLMKKVQAEGDSAMPELTAHLDTFPRPDKLGSELLLKNGIPGNKYLDRDSRLHGGEPTNNFVVFDPKYAKFLEKNGEAIEQPKATPAKALAPANEQGFYSPTEAAGLNLKRQSGNGQAFLNDIMKGENVRSEEISAMGLDTFLKDKKNITAAEVQDYIAKNKLGLGEARYGALTKNISESRDAFKAYSQELASKYELNPNENISMYARLKNIPAEEIAKYERLQNEWLDQQPKSPKFEGWQLPGGENYREVVITMPTKVDQRGFFIDRDGDKFYLRNHDGKTLGEYGSRYEAQEAMQKNTSQDYKSSHWNEPNALAHLRMSDRVTDGKKTLLVDEVQSDWHQAGREQGYKLPPEATAPMDSEYRALVHKNADAVAQGLTPDPKDVARAKMLENQLMQSDSSKVPNAPYKEDWYQLALRRAVKEAIDGGYDRVALPTGKRVIDRFSDQLRQNVDEINFSTDYRNKDKIIVAASKQGQIMFEGNIVDGKFIDGPAQGKTVNEVLGKSIAKQIYSHNPSSGLGVIKGDDLSIGGEGMKKYYDEIYPTYLKKFGKKYGANVGKTTVDADGVAEPLHYMDITPAMRKEFSTGIHMKKGGKVSFASNIDAMRHELNKRQ